TDGAFAGLQQFARWNQGARLPTFGALDFRVDRRWSLRRAQIVTYLDIQNLTGRENVSGLQWNQRTRAVEQNTSLGLLPSIGFSIDF
ncbi:MAG: TonB-dependent receptor, partial [Gemmatimonadota bacterium]